MSSDDDTRLIRARELRSGMIVVEADVGSTPASPVPPIERVVYRTHHDLVAGESTVVFEDGKRVRYMLDPEDGEDDVVAVLTSEIDF